MHFLLYWYFYLKLFYSNHSRYTGNNIIWQFNFNFFLQRNLLPNQIIHDQSYWLYYYVWHRLFNNIRNRLSWSYNTRRNNHHRIPRIITSYYTLYKIFMYVIIINIIWFEVDRKSLIFRVKRKTPIPTYRYLKRITCRTTRNMIIIITYYI